MGFDFVVQHELQRRTGDFVIVDNEHTPVIDGFRCFDTDLHVALAETRVPCPAERLSGLLANSVPRHALPARRSSKRE
jgi:hypothetical protein